MPQLTKTKQKEKRGLESDQTVPRPTEASKVKPVWEKIKQSIFTIQLVKAISS